MLETLADHDDELMEQLLEDIQPPRDKIFDDLSKEVREGLSVRSCSARPRAPTACCG
jgi:elongation factor G